MLRHDEDRDGGYTLVEMMVVVLIMSIILGGLLGALLSGQTAQANTEALVTNQESVRLALDQMQQDLTEANPLDALPATSDYANEVQVDIPSPSGGAQQVVRWYYDPATGTLYRELLSNDSPDPTVLSQRAVLQHVTNAGAGVTLFTYYDANNNDLQNAYPDAPTDVANCAIRIHIDLAAESDPGPLPFQETIDVELRNRLPGGIIGCPNGS